jgi:hypothetical protein
MDWMNVAVLAIGALTSVLTMVAVWALKLAWSKIPASWLFIVSPLVGMLLNYLLSLIAAAVPANPVIGAFLGLAAVIIREFLTTLQTKGLFGSVSQTKGMF